MAEGLYRQGDKFTRHKNAIFQYENEIRQNRRIMDFLHDDILQDLYAIKLLLENKNSGKDNEIIVPQPYDGILYCMIRERVLSLGGTFDITRADKGGLMINVEL